MKTHGTSNIVFSCNLSYSKSTVLQNDRNVQFLGENKKNVDVAYNKILYRIMLPHTPLYEKRTMLNAGH